MIDAPPDRRHNREEDSPEALRRSIETLTQAIATLDRRLDEATLRLDGEVDCARSTTRRLATEVGLMGEALVRRMEADRARSIPIKPRPQSVWPLAVALVVGSMLAIVGFILFSK